MSAYYSTLGGWLIPFSRVMQLNKIDLAQALAECDITPKDFENQESRIAVEKLALLLDYCNSKVPRKDMTVQIARQFHPGMFHALGYAMMSSNSLKDALARIAQYKRVVSNTCSLLLQESHEGLLFQLNVVCYEDSHRPVIAPSVVETFIATIVQFAREVVDPELHPKKLLLKAGPPVGQYQAEFFNCEILYHQPIDAILFDSIQASQRLMSGNPLITQVHEKMLDEFLSRIDKSDLIHVVKSRIYQHLALGAPSQVEMATMLGMSLRNLQRRLQEKGSNYKDILEQTRKKLALDYIEQPHLSLGEIGYLVGFSSVGNFNRAFKRWTQQTPGEYRSQLTKLSEHSSRR